MKREELIESIMALRDGRGRWNAELPDNCGPELTYYVPNYKSTLWTLVLLADLGCDGTDERVKPALKVMADHFWDGESGVFSIGGSHFPIPCLNGNMLYLLHYFRMGGDARIGRVIDFFHRYQRYDDGDFVTPKDFPYCRNRSCYGAHTCYWGVVKLLKGLSFIPERDRTARAESLRGRCVDFILMHHVCFSSRRPSELLHKMIGRLTFPNMYKADFLEVLWLLKREGIRSGRMAGALELLQSKMKPDGTWSLERQIKDLIVPVTGKKLGDGLITERARDVMGYYGSHA